MRSRLRDQGQPYWLALFLMLGQSLWSPLLMAHGAGPRWTARLDAQLSLPADMQVQIRHSLAPQVLLSNHSAQTLEVLDPRGRAFIRIGPAGVHADLHASAWYNTYSVAGLAIPAAAQDPQAPARWRQLSEEPSWGWFDPRLSPEGEPGDQARPGAQNLRWSIPLRLEGGPEIALQGYFAQTQQQGRWQSRLLRSGRINEDLSLGLIPGPVDAFMLRNQSAEPVTVMGLEAEPFLRLGPEGVYANAASATWRAWGRSRFDTTPQTSAELNWIKISSSPTYTWLDPRSRPDINLTEQMPAEPPAHDWSIPLLIAGKLQSLPGQSQWQPAAPADQGMPSMDMGMAMEQGAAHAHRPAPAPKPWPRVQLQVEPDSMSGWNVHVRTDNFRFSPETAGAQLQPGQGHAHLYVDGKKVARLYGPWFHLPHLTPGSHYLHVTLNADDHSVWTADGRLIGHRIRVEVPPAQTQMQGMPMSGGPTAHSAMPMPDMSSAPQPVKPADIASP